MKPSETYRLHLLSYERETQNETPLYACGLLYFSDCIYGLRLCDDFGRFQEDSAHQNIEGYL